MTAEIAIMNSQGIALAADSAVTIGRNRVWKTANKLFSLGPANDIAIMIYNAGDFVGIPWEVVVKEFRDQVGLKEYKTIKECEKAFFDYLDQDQFSADYESDYSIISVLISMIDKHVPQAKYKTLKQLQEQLSTTISETLEETKDIPELTNVMSLGVFKKKFQSNIAAICKDSFGFRLTRPYLTQLTEMLYSLIVKQVSSSFMSGIVFAGFGKSQLMPCITHYCVDGRMQYTEKNIEISQTRFWLEHRCDLSDAEASTAYVFPFAQMDIFYLFMEGIIPRYLSYISSILESVLRDKSTNLVNNFVPPSNQIVEQKLQEAENEAIVEAFHVAFSRFRKETLVGPVLDVIKALPKEEMAAMAEALVELTALRRKIGSNLETVGGPTDVAVISKGEGLIWLKRKHYFNPELNSDFAVRKRLKLTGKPDA